MTDEQRAARNEQIRSERAAGATLRQIAARHNLSHERVRQVCRRRPRVVVPAAGGGAGLTERLAVGDNGDG